MSDLIDLSSARDLIKWAREDILDFDYGCEAYFGANPYVLFEEDDPETGHVFRKLAIKAPVPDKLRKLASHALWDLKHALDHATYAAILAVTGVGPKDTYFPWASHPNDLDVKLTHVSKAHPNGKYPPELHGLFRRFEPYPTGGTYPGGGDVFVALNKMANTSKHAVTLKPGINIFLEQFRLSGGVVQVWPNWWDGAKQEFTIGLFIKGAKVEMDLQFASFIEFAEVEVLEGHPAGDVLDEFAKAVSGVVDDFEAEVTSILAARG